MYHKLLQEVAGKGSKGLGQIVDPKECKTLNISSGAQQMM